MTTIRAYRPDDAGACLAVFDSNVPDYFAPAERRDFQHFLHAAARSTAYLVIDSQDGVLACGGLSVTGNGVAGFCWGMVRRDHHRQGLGRQLAQARLERARQQPHLQRIELCTSQHTRAFYERLGFQLTRSVADGHGPGLDALDMVLVLRGA